MNKRTGYLVPLLHLLFWISATAVVWYFVFAGEGMDDLVPFYLVSGTWNIALFYVNACFLVPALFTRRRWPWYVLSLAVLVLVSYWAKQVMMGNLAVDLLVLGLNPYSAHFTTVVFLPGSLVSRLAYNGVRKLRAGKPTGQ